MVGQIERFRETPGDSRVPFDKRQQAIKCLVHFVGGLHHPLHACQNQDRGGNNVKAESLGKAVNPFTKKHGIFIRVGDNGLLDHYAVDATQAVDQIDYFLMGQNEAKLAQASIIQWARQSHDQARDHAYRFAADKRLGEEYLKPALPM